MADLKKLADSLITKTNTISSSNINQLKVAAYTVDSGDGFTDFGKISHKVEDYDTDLGDAVYAVANGFRFTVMHAGKVKAASEK